MVKIHMKIDIMTVLSPNLYIAILVLIIVARTDFKIRPNIHFVSIDQIQ